MADRHHFEKPLNRRNSAMVQRIIMKFGMMTLFDFLKRSNGQKFNSLMNQEGERPVLGRVPDICCRCRWGCILAQPGEFD